MGVPITPATHVEAPAIGAAILAGMATEQFKSFEESVEIVVGKGEPIVPDPNSHEQYKALRIEWDRLRNVVYPDFAS